MLIPILLLVVLIVAVASAHSMRKKGTMSDAAYSKVVSAVSVIVTVVALAILYIRLR